MKVLSVFDGKSCGRIALQRAGIKVSKYYSSEIDRFAIEVADRNWPEDSEYRLGDICQLDAKGLEVDLLIGGSPCQSFSRSGNGSGFDGKSGLFWEYVRILEECKPRYFLLENVVMKKEWEDEITETLGVEPVEINSSLVSAQKRPRLYWTNIPFQREIEDRNILLKDIVEGEREVINDHPVVLDHKNGCFVIRNATKKGFLIATEGDSVNLEVPTSKTRRGRVGEGKTNTLNTACNYGMVKGGNLVKLDIEDYERLQTLPAGYTEGVSENQRRKMIGNGWTVDVISHIFQGLK